MGFLDRYTVSSQGLYSVNSVKSTFLPFWGFSASEEHDTYYSYTAEKTTIESIGNGKWEVKTTPESVSTHYGTKYFEFKRLGYRFLDEKEKALENRFYSMVESKYSTQGTFYPGKTPYLHTSVKEFYDDRINPMGRLGWFIGLFPLCVLLLFGYFLDVIQPFCNSVAQFAFIVDVIQPYYNSVVVIALIVGTIWCTISVIGFKILKVIWYNKLSKAKKRKIRKKYLKSLNVGIEEANAILREYAILKGYDKI